MMVMEKRLLKHTRMEGLQRFANHTRHRTPRDGDLTMLGRKWMVAHVAPASPETYAFVAEDYALVRAKTHSPPLESYAESSHPVDVDTFVWLAKNGYPAARPLTLEEEQQWPALAQFRDTLWPAPVDEETWQPFERRDHWKERAYFLAAAGACKNKPQFHALVERICSEPLAEPLGSASVATPVIPTDSKEQTPTVAETVAKPLETAKPKGLADTVSDLYTRILRVIPDCTPSAQEIGTLIAALDLRHLDNEQGGPSCEAARQEYLAEKHQEEKQHKVDVPIERPIILLVNSSSTTGSPEATANAVVEDESVTAFRQRELIPPTFPTHKVMQQMLLTHLGQQVPSHLLSSVQRRRGSPEGPVTLGDAVWQWLDSIPSEKIAAHLDLQCPQLQSYYFGRSDAGQPITPQALVRGVLQDERHRKLWPVVESSLITAIKEI
jgi:hypothetical protein